MSWGRSPFENDPFFSRPPSMGFSMGFPPFPMLGFPGEDRSRHRQPTDPHQGRRQDRQLSLMDPFSMFNNMDRMMNDAFRHHDSALRHREEPNGTYYSSSSVMHFSSSGAQNGNPHVYHATSSVTKGPGGVKETRRSEADSRTGMKKMAIGHHIGDRSHTIEKRHNTHTKDLEQHQEFINMDERDALGFDQEWQQKTRKYRQHQPSVRSDRDQLAHRRGLGGLTDTPPAAGPSNGSRRFSWDPPPPEEGVQRSRDYRSRSPEKRGGDHAHPTPPYADTEAERRQEYLKARKERKVKF